MLTSTWFARSRTVWLPSGTTIVNARKCTSTRLPESGLYQPQYRRPSISCVKYTRLSDRLEGMESESGRLLRSAYGSGSGDWIRERPHSLKRPRLLHVSQSKCRQACTPAPKRGHCRSAWRSKSAAGTEVTRSAVLRWRSERPAAAAASVRVRGTVPSCARASASRWFFAGSICFSSSPHRRIARAWMRSDR